MADTDLTIQPARSKADIKAFITFPYDLYRGEPSWRPPLRFERFDFHNPKKNPVLSEIDAEYFLARRGGKIVGRIVAFVNQVHLRTHNDNTGHFGFLDCETNPETGAALMATAETWVRQKGMTRMTGPLQWSVNDQCGLLIDGFDTPNVMMMPYGRADYQAVVEGAGFAKDVDLYAFQDELAEGFPRPRTAQVVRRAAERDPDIVIRPMRPECFMEEVRLAMDIFNDAWSENWGFLPFSEEQVAHMAKDIRPLMFKEGFWFAEVKGEPIAFSWMVPDLNSAIHDLDGHILPFGWAKLLWRLKVKGVKQARLPLMGLRRSHHNSRKGVCAMVLMCETMFEAAVEQGYKYCEHSWVLETNQNMINICEYASADLYKTYRMYEKHL